MKSILYCTYNRLGSFLIGCVLVIITLCCVCPNAYAETSADKRAQADALVAQINDLQTQLNQANAEYDESVANYSQAKASCDDAQQREHEAEQQVSGNQDKLASTAKTMYKLGSSSFLDVALGSDSFDSFIKSYDAMGAISDYSAQLVQESKDARDTAEAARSDYQEQSDRASSEMQRADQIRQTIESTQSSMKQQVSQLTAEAAELQAEEELQAEAAQQSAAAARASSSYIDASQCQFVDGNGRLANPCPAGTLSSGFGYRDFDSAFHKGIDLAAAEGTPYYAADSGTVIYATNDGSYNGGAGNWIVIAHGDGLVTKYMHSSAVFVSVGDTVTRGQLIGAVGNTGDSYGAHLHFQVELNGTAVNPFLYL